MTRFSFRELWIPLSLFGFSRVVVYALGVRFFHGHLGRMMPFVDVDLLRDDLLRTLWLMDGQPPRFNLFLGLVVKSGSLSLFPVTFALIGAVITGGVYVILRSRGFSLWASTVLAMLFAVSPSALLYENYLFYTYPVAGLLVLATVALDSAATSHRVRAWLLFWAALGAVGFTRSAFHVAFIVLVLVAAILLFPERRRLVLASAALPLLLVASVYAKNLYLHGSFSSSSWLGISLAPLTTDQLPRAEKRRWLAQGRLTPVSFVQRFSPIPRFRRALPDFRPDPRTDQHPLRRQERKSGGDINYHHALYSAAARASLQDAWVVIQARPDLYFRAVGRAYLRFTTSPAEWRPLENLRVRLGAYARSLPRWASVDLGHSRPGPAFIVLPILVVVAVRELLLTFSRRSREPEQLARLFSLTSILYVTAVGSLLDYGENNRFRFMVEPLIFAETAALIGVWLARVRGKNRHGGA